MIVAAALILSRRSAGASHDGRTPVAAQTLHGATLPPAVQTRLTQIARRQAHDNHGTSITAQVVRTTYYRAELVALDGGTDNAAEQAA